jgi:hypothetical protein
MKQVATVNFGVDVLAPAPAQVTINLLNGTIPNPVLGQAYNYQVSITGGVTPYTITATLPPGLVIDNTGHITGTPTAEGENIPCSISVADTGN